MTVAVTQEAESDEGIEPISASLTANFRRQGGPGGWRRFRRDWRKRFNRRKDQGLGRSVMRHFLGLAVPVVGLATGMITRAPWRLLITGTGGPPGFEAG